jgi:hypothetical protein
VVTFCTVIKTGDALISMWGGSDYADPRVKACSTYICTQYECVRMAIQDPAVKQMDFGASHRTMKTGLRAQGHLVSGYVRCSSKAAAKVVKLFAADKYDPTGLANDF